MASSAPVVLAGDYNVVPTPQDISPTRSLDNNALIQPQSRQAFARLLTQMTPCGSFILTGRCGHSGITNSNGGRRIKACGSITSCFPQTCHTASWREVLTDGRVGKKTRATMLQHGSRSIFERLSSFARPKCLHQVSEAHH